MGLSLCRGPVGETGWGLILLGTYRDRWRALEMEHLSHYGSSARVTWRDSSFTGDPEG